MNRSDIYGAITAEREVQAERWGGAHAWGEGDCSSGTVAPTTKVAVLTEECGEVARAVLDGQPELLRRELVQVAAVAVAWLEGLEG